MINVPIKKTKPIPPTKRYLQAIDRNNRYSFMKNKIKWKCMHNKLTYFRVDFVNMDYSLKDMV